MRRGLVRLVAVPALAAQSSAGMTGSVTFAADELRAWLCGGWNRRWSCPLPSAWALSLLSHRSSLFPPAFDVFFDGKRPPATVGSCRFPARWVDVCQLSCLLCRPVYSKVQAFLQVWSHLQARCIICPWEIRPRRACGWHGQASAGTLWQQSKHAWYCCLGQDIPVGDAVCPSDPDNPPEVVQVEGVCALGRTTGSRTRCRRDMIWYDVMWCDVMWCDVMWCDVTWRDVTWRDMTWHDMTWHDMTWHDMTWSSLESTGHLSSHLSSESLTHTTQHQQLYVNPQPCYFSLEIILKGMVFSIV